MQTTARTWTWLFVQGAPHSGSTLLNELLSTSNVTNLCRVQGGGYHAEIMSLTSDTDLFLNTANAEDSWQRYRHEHVVEVPSPSMEDFETVLDSAVLDPSAAIRVAKDPFTLLFWEAAISAHFGSSARFIVLTREPYVHAYKLTP